MYIDKKREKDMKTTYGLLHYCSSVLLIVLMSFVFSAASFGAGGDLVSPFDPYVHARANKQFPSAFGVDSAGNIVFTGYSAEGSPTYDDFYTVKILANGTLDWNLTKDYDSSNQGDRATAMVIDSEDSVIVTGYVYDAVAANFDIYTIRYLSDGSIDWEHRFDASGTGAEDRPLAIAVDSSNNIYIGAKSFIDNGGTWSMDYTVLKYKKTGPDANAPEWTAYYNGTGDGDDLISDIVAGIDGVAVTGKSWNGSDHDSLTVKYDYSGSPVWSGGMIVAGTDSNDDTGKAVGMDSSGNVVVAATIQNTATHMDIYIVKYDGSSTGGVLAGFTPVNYDYLGSEDEPADVWVDSSGNIYVTGYVTDGTSTDVYTAKYNGANGSLMWPSVDIYDTGSSNSDTGNRLALDESGDLFVAGDTWKATPLDNYDFLTIKYAKNSGALLWTRLFDGSANLNDRTTGIGFSPAGEVIVGGWTAVTAIDYDFAVLKYEAGAVNAPSDLTATTTDMGPPIEITLTWYDNSEAPREEEEFWIFRKIGEESSYPPTPLDTVPGTAGLGTRTYYDTDSLVAGTVYYYKVQAYSSTLGLSAFSNEVSVLATIFSYGAPADSFTYDAFNQNDQVEGIAAGPDNHPVITGFSYTDDTYVEDYYTLKLDKDDFSAVPFWEKTFDGSEMKPDEGRAIAADSSNNVFVTGISEVWGGSKDTVDMYTLKYDSSGFDSWSPQYRYDSGEDDTPIDIAVSNNSGNVVVVGYVNDGAGNNNILGTYFLSNDDLDDGTVVWETMLYTGTGDNQPNAVAFDSSGNIFVTGYVNGTGTKTDMFTAKYSAADGTLLWPSEVIYSPRNGFHTGVALAVDSGGDVYVTGSETNTSGDRDYYTVKYSGSDGSIVTGWPVPFASSNNGEDYPAAIEIDPIDGDIVVAGTSGFVTAASDSDFHVIRYHTDGTEAWVPAGGRLLDRFGSDEIAKGMVMDGSGNIHIAGNAKNGAYDDALSVEYDYQGLFMGGTDYAGADGKNEGVTTIAINNKGEAFVGGFTTIDGVPLTKDYMVFKVAKNPLTIAAPYPLTATIYYTQVVLNWLDNSDVNDEYILQRENGACSSSTPWDPGDTIYTSGPNDITYPDSGLNKGTTYCYRVKAEISASGVSSRWVELTVTTLIPPKPVITNVTAINTTEIEIKWTDTTLNEDVFTIQRCDADTYACDQVVDAEFVTVGTQSGESGSIGNTLTFTDNTACYGGNYKYRINATKNTPTPNVWTSDWSDTSNAVSTASITDPDGLSVTRVSELEIMLEWNGRTSDETGFKIQRCNGGASAPCSTFSSDIEYTFDSFADNMNDVMVLHMEESLWDGTPDQIIDSSVLGVNHGTSNGATSTADGYFGRGGNFDSGNYVTVQDDSSLDISDVVTIEAWVRLDSYTGTWNLIAVKGNTSTNRNYGLWVENTGDILLSYYNGGYKSYNPTGPNFTLGAWHHIVGVIDVANDYWAIHLDKAKYEQSGAGLVDMLANNESLYIGSRTGTWNLDGTIDEVAIYNRALGDSEIAQHFDHGPQSTVKKRYFDSDFPSADMYYTYKLFAFKDAPACDPDPNGWETGFTTEENAKAVLEPPVLDNVTAQNTTDTLIEWTDKTTSATGYTIERCLGDYNTCGSFCSVATGTSCYLDSDCPGAETCVPKFTVDPSFTATINDPDITTYIDTEGCPDSDYSYRVMSDGDGIKWTQTSPSNVLADKTDAITKPVIINVTTDSETQLLVEWDFAPPAHDETGYIIERCEGSTSCTSWSTIALVDPDDLKTVHNSALVLHMDEDPAWTGGAGEVEDSSEFGNNGQAKNGVLNDQQGRFGMAGNFDSSNNHYVEVPHDNSLNPDQRYFTVEAWAKSNTPYLWNSSFNLIGKENSTYGYRLYASSNTQNVGFVIYFYDNNNNIRSDGATFTPDPPFDFDITEWHHYAVVFDYDTFIFYVDGIEDHREALSYTFDRYRENTYAVNIGRDGSAYFNGLIDDVAVHMDALSPSEINRHYRLGAQSHVNKHYLDTGLTTGQTYRYRISAYKTTPLCPGGQWLTISDPSEPVDSEPVSAVLAPTNLVATASETSTTDITLTWDDNTTSEEGFTINRCDSAGCDPTSTVDKTFDIPRALPADALSRDNESFTDSTVCPGVTYNYAIQAYDNAPVWTTSWDVSNEPTTLTMTAPSNMNALLISETQIDVDWTDNTDDETRFELEWCDVASACDEPADWTPVTLAVAADLDTVNGDLVVLHMNEDEWITGAGEVKDSSRYDSSYPARYYSGNGDENDGEAFGTAVPVDGGLFGNSASLDGNSDYIRIPYDTGSFDTQEAITVEFWANSDVATWPGQTNPLTRYNFYEFWGDNGNKNIKFRFRTGNGSADVIYTLPAITGWHHYAGVYDGASSTLKLYVDGGVPKQTKTLKGYGYHSTRFIEVGTYSSYYVDGLMDDVAIYNRALTDAEIDRHFRLGVQSYYTKRYSDTNAQMNVTYRYRVRAFKDAPFCTTPERRYTDYVESTPDIPVQPKAPDQVTVDIVPADGTSEIEITWRNNTSGEDEYEIQRCIGDYNACGSFCSVTTATACSTDADCPVTETCVENFTLDAPAFTVTSAPSTSFTDDTACPGTMYTYRVRGRDTDVWGYTGWSIMDSNSDDQTDSPAATTATPKLAQAVSEMQISLQWSDTNYDHAGFNIYKCLGDSCTPAYLTSVASNVFTYQDMGLIPATPYTYKVTAYKTAPACKGAGWENSGVTDTEYTDPAVKPTGLTAVKDNTTDITLNWTNNTDLETGIVIERCNGDCMLGGTFGYLNAAPAGATTYTDTTACYDSTYTYRVKAVFQGLSEHGLGCWTNRVKINIANFSTDYRMNIDVDADDYPGMQSDFRDVRFYDDTTGLELSYAIEYIESSTNVASIIFETLKNNDIYMYYGNSNATSASDIYYFYEFYDDFRGTEIDTSKWVEVDFIYNQPDGLITQNDGLQLAGSGSRWTTALVSSESNEFVRANGREIYARLTTGADTNKSFMLGWNKNQNDFDLSPIEKEFRHGLWFYSRNFYANHGASTPFYNNSSSDTGDNYLVNTEYEVRIMLKSSGATYHVRSDEDGAYSDWVQIYNYSSISTTPLRIGFGQLNHSATIHFIGVRKDYTYVSPGPSISSMGSIEDITDVGGPAGQCPDVFSNEWFSAVSDPAFDKTDNIIDPTDLSAAVLGNAQIDLGWSDTNNDETGFKIERCDLPSCTPATYADADGDNISTYSDTAILTSVDYNYRVKAYKLSSGCSVCGQPACKYIVADDEWIWESGASNEFNILSAPAAPTNLQVTPDGSMKMDLSWSHNLSGVDGFEIFVLVSTSTYALIGTSTDNTYTDAISLQPDTTYTYKVRAYKGTLTKSDFAGPVSATTDVFDPLHDTCVAP